jgi:hypothetical protein
MTMEREASDNPFDAVIDLRTPPLEIVFQNVL